MQDRELDALLDVTFHTFEFQGLLVFLFYCVRNKEVCKINGVTIFHIYCTWGYWKV